MISNCSCLEVERFGTGRYRLSLLLLKLLFLLLLANFSTVMNFSGEKSEDFACLTYWQVPIMSVTSQRTLTSFLLWLTWSVTSHRTLTSLLLDWQALKITRIFLKMSPCQDFVTFSHGFCWFYLAKYRQNLQSWKSCLLSMKRSTLETWRSEKVRKNFICRIFLSAVRPSLFSSSLRFRGWRQSGKGVSRSKSNFWTLGKLNFF